MSDIEPADAEIRQLRDRTAQTVNHLEEFRDRDEPRLSAPELADVQEHIRLWMEVANRLALLSDDGLPAGRAVIPDIVAGMDATSRAIDDRELSLTLSNSASTLKRILRFFEINNAALGSLPGDPTQDER
jgi:hypothetical protein